MDCEPGDFHPIDDTAKPMPEQHSLPGFDPAPKPTDSLFFAIVPSPDAAASIGRQAALLRNEYGLTGSPLSSSRLHVSLNHAGVFAGLPKDILAAAMAAAASVRVRPFEIAFERAVSFRGKPGSRPLVLLGDDGTAGVIALQQALGAALQKAGVGRANPNFLPHMTLLYDDHDVPDQAIEPIAWTVREFVLVHSLLGQTRHIPLARWPLSA